jgi:hypothetical protein
VRLLPFRDLVLLSREYAARARPLKLQVEPESRWASRTWDEIRQDEVDQRINERAEDFGHFVGGQLSDLAREPRAPRWRAQFRQLVGRLRRPDSFKRQIPRADARSVDARSRGYTMTRDIDASSITFDPDVAVITNGYVLAERRPDDFAPDEGGALVARRSDELGRLVEDMQRRIAAAAGLPATILLGDTRAGTQLAEQERSFFERTLRRDPMNQLIAIERIGSPEPMPIPAALGEMFTFRSRNMLTVRYPGRRSASRRWRASFAQLLEVAGDAVEAGETGRALSVLCEMVSLGDAETIVYDRAWPRTSWVSYPRHQAMVTEINV